MYRAVLDPLTERIAEADGATTLAGTLHVYVAFDWGEEVDLERVRRLVPAERQVLPRRRRTPSSIAYRPSPLRFALAAVPVEFAEIGSVQVGAEATVFDFAAVSVALHVPFRLSEVALSRLASSFTDPAALVQAARAAVEPLRQKILPAIQHPTASNLSEEYFVFEIPPGDAVPSAEMLLDSRAAWLAGLLRMESAPLSSEEVEEAVRLHLRYCRADLLVADWAAAVLVDCDCDETLQVIEFANMQLLEFREIDQRLDDRLTAAYGLIHPLAQSWLPLWRTHARPLRALGELKVDANALFERASNVLKLVGDQYLARAYRLLATRFHLTEWEGSIRRSLEVVESVYQVLSDQAAKYRTEFLEATIVLLILFEIVMAFVRH